MLTNTSTSVAAALKKWANTHPFSECWPQPGQMIKAIYCEETDSLDVEVYNEEFWIKAIEVPPKRLLGTVFTKSNEFYGFLIGVKQTKGFVYLPCKPQRQQHKFTWLTQISLVEKGDTLKLAFPMISKIKQYFGAGK